MSFIHGNRIWKSLKDAGAFPFESQETVCLWYKNFFAWWSPVAFTLKRSNSINEI